MRKRRLRPTVTVLHPMKGVLRALCVIGAAAGSGALRTPPARAAINSLPGWEGPLPSKMYNGWIDAGLPPSGVGTMCDLPTHAFRSSSCLLSHFFFFTKSHASVRRSRYFHYWFVESERDPATDPLLVNPPLSPINHDSRKP